MNQASFFLSRVTNPEPCLYEKRHSNSISRGSLSLTPAENHIFLECNFLHVSAEDTEFIKERSRKNVNCKKRTKGAL